MPTPTHRPYLVVLRPEEVNGHLCAHEGKLLINLLNYTELLVELPAITDERLQVFEVEAPVDLLNVRQDGDRTVHMLWAGEKHAKTRPQDRVSVSIRSQVGFVSDGQGTADPVAIAGAIFAGFPPKVQLGAAVLNVDDAAIASLGLEPVAARAWAQKQVATQAAAASA